MKSRYFQNFSQLLLVLSIVSQQARGENLIPTPFIKDVGPATEGVYETLSVPNEEVDKHLIIANEATETPYPLQGLWWLDGNTQPDEVISFAKVKWKIKDNFWGEPVGFEGDFVVFDDRVWTWHDSDAGRKAFNKAYYTQLVYKITFNKDFSEAVFVPDFKLYENIGSLLLPNSPVLDFRMTKVDDNEFTRNTNFFGFKDTYRFRRIVDGDGNRLPAYDEFVKKSEAPRQLIPQCIAGEGPQLNDLSICAQEALN